MKRMILEYLGGIETLDEGIKDFQKPETILEYLGGIETGRIEVFRVGKWKILEYLGGIETYHRRLLFHRLFQDFRIPRRD